MTDDTLERAFGYPYPAPEASYLFTHAGTQPFDPALTEGRVPLLAFGSNRAPVQLARKFRHIQDVAIPVEAAWLDGFDVVHAATLTRYGAVPAMLHASPGTRVALMVTWLTGAELAHMHSTELGAANYAYATVPGRLETEHGTRLDAVLTYVGTRGAFTAPDAPAIALQRVRAEGRRLVDADTRTMLTRFAAILRWSGTVESFVAAAVKDETRRRAWVDRLADHAAPINHPWDRLA
jgi:hypothetical protein